MKKFTLLFASILIIFNVHAQVIVLDDEENNVSNDTIHVAGDPGADVIKVNIAFSNQTEQKAFVFVRKHEIEIAEGSSVAFCWNDFCFSPAVTEVEDPIALEPGEQSGENDFYTEIYPQNTEGTSTVQYEFYSDRDDFEAVFVTVIFEIGQNTSTNDPFSAGNYNLSSPYPNPASNFTNINYNIPAANGATELVIRNLVGKMVYKTPLDIASNKLRINTSNFSNGIYIYSLVHNGQTIESRRLMVSN